MHWQLSQFLPAPLQPVFHDWVVEFIELMHNLKRPRTLTSTDQTSTPRPTQLPIKNLAEDAEDGTTILDKSFQKPLKKQITALIRRQREEMLHPSLAADHVFPTLPGSHLTPTNPVLELVKSLTQVLSLDKTIALEARLLRKELLSLFDVREFSAEAHFSNPSSSLRIQQLVCDHCTMARDLDLCRDEDLLPDPNATAGTAARPWKCLTCGAEYDRLAIEEKLIARVQAMLVQWTTQDLKCGKCRSIRVNEFMEHCACSGEWVGTVRREDVVGKLEVMGRVAAFYGLRMLADVVGGVVGGL